jgi:hypothetical protein
MMRITIAAIVMGCVNARSVVRVVSRWANTGESIGALVTAGKPETLDTERLFA